jgi:ABC-type polysaccharide/polyol phosphate transport system ATPase subunit
MSSSSGVLAELHHVGKRYLLGQRRGARGVVLDLLGHRDPRKDLWALHDISFALGRGDSLGVIGRNGAGKTTLLRLLAGISRPTRGTVLTYGRVASLLNVGAGFHPELSGRENVLLNGVILGLSRTEASRKFDTIVEFSGLDEQFLDIPVKHYSSGMYARLAFAVAAHVNPDVLLVDEVLSVGDAAFQDRSMRKMLDFRSRSAVVFVSHNLSAVEMVCNQAIWLERGVVRATGETSDVIRAYLDDTDDADEAHGDTALTIDRVQVLDCHGQLADSLAGGAPFSVVLEGCALQALIEPVFVVTIRGDYGPLFAGNMHIDGNWPRDLPAGPFRVSCDFDSPRLRPGRYRVEVKVKQNVRTNYYEPRIKATFAIAGQTETPGGGDVPYAMIGDR